MIMIVIIIILIMLDNLQVLVKLVQVNGHQMQVLHECNHPSLLDVLTHHLHAIQNGAGQAKLRGQEESHGGDALLEILGD